MVSRRTALAGAASLALATVAACSGSRRTQTSATDSPVTTEPSAEPTTTPTTTPTTEPPTTAPAADEYFPPDSGEWATVTPADAGFTDDGLAAVVELVAASNSQSLVVLSGGRIVVEQYWRGAQASTVRDVASVQKSVVSTLLGIARDRGLLTFDQSVTTFLGAGWSRAAAADEASITVFHLLTMSSGLSPRNLTRVAAPGTVWDYNTDAYQRLRRVLEAAAGQDINTLTNEWLFVPIGIASPAPWGVRPGASDPLGEPLWGLRLAAREMARYGLFAMRNGRWAGRQITSPDWFAEAWAPTALKGDYGYLWWLVGRGHLRRQGAPADLVAALGAADQKIYVLPSADLVLVRQGEAAGRASDNESDFDALLVAAMGRARF